MFLSKQAAGEITTFYTTSYMAKKFEGPVLVSLTFCSSDAWNFRH